MAGELGPLTEGRGELPVVYREASGQVGSALEMCARMDYLQRCLTGGPFGFHEVKDTYGGNSLWKEMGDVQESFSVNTTPCQCMVFQAEQEWQGVRRLIGSLFTPVEYGRVVNMGEELGIGWQGTSLQAKLDEQARRQRIAASPILATAFLSNQHCEFLMLCPEAIVYTRPELCPMRDLFPDVSPENLPRPGWPKGGRPPRVLNAPGQGGQWTCIICPGCADNPREKHRQGDFMASCCNQRDQYRAARQAVGGSPPPWCTELDGVPVWLKENKLNQPHILTAAHAANVLRTYLCTYEQVIDATLLGLCWLYGTTLVAQYVMAYYSVLNEVPFELQDERWNPGVDDHLDPDAQEQRKADIAAINKQRARARDAYDREGVVDDSERFLAFLEGAFRFASILTRARRGDQEHNLSIMSNGATIRRRGVGPSWFPVQQDAPRTFMLPPESLYCTRSRLLSKFMFPTARESEEDWTRDLGDDSSSSSGDDDENQDADTRPPGERERLRRLAGNFRSRDWRT